MGGKCYTKDWGGDNITIVCGGLCTGQSVTVGCNGTGNCKGLKDKFIT